MVDAAWNDAMAAIADRLRQATVQIRSSQSSAGSGVIWSADGLIVTNAHVLGTSQRSKWGTRRGTRHGGTVEVELGNGQVLAARAIASDAQRDLAVLQVDATDLPTVPIGDSDRLRVGEWVMAVGNPFGVVGALTTGIIHTTGSGDRHPMIQPRIQTRSQDWIQADIRLAPGNSGGALANAQGQVIGINAMIVNGLGFAVPSNSVQWFLNHYRDRPYLGVTLEPVIVSVQRRPIYGLVITKIEPDSPAAAALLPGDVLIGVRRIPFQTTDELLQILERSHSGDGLPLNVLRDGNQLAIEVVVYSRESQQSMQAA